jgi:hypothetical protein
MYHDGEETDTESANITYQDLKLKREVPSLYDFFIYKNSDVLSKKKCDNLNM